MKYHTQIISGRLIDRLIANAVRYGIKEGFIQSCDHYVTTQEQGEIVKQAIKNARRTISKEDKRPFK